LTLQKQYDKALELLNFLNDQIYKNSGVAHFFNLMGDALEKEIDLYFKDNIRKFELKYMKRYQHEHFFQLRDFIESHKNWKKYFAIKDTVISTFHSIQTSQKTM